MPAPTGYLLKKEVPITGATGAGADYQVMLTVHAGAGADSAGVVYLNNKCTDFPNDIRFTNDADDTELSHWYETNTGTATTKYFWVKVTDSLESGTSNIYIYAGKAGAASASSGPQAFQFF